MADGFFVTMAEYRVLMARVEELERLRLALREPSDELLERLVDTFCHTALNAYSEDSMRATLAALAEAVTPDGK
jgi:hypothetical protein